MCYGDIDHGSDGYYREYMERCAEQEAEKRAAEERHWQEEMERQRIKADATPTE